jgi:hypothetical protein
MDDLTAFITARLAEDERELAKDPPAGLGYASLAAQTARDITAKRAILRRCEATMDEPDQYPNGLVSPRAALARQVIANLAAIWSGHADYSEEWKPWAG